MENSTQTISIFSRLFQSNGERRQHGDKSYAYMGLIPVSKFVYSFISLGTPRKSHHNIRSILGVILVKEKKKRGGKGRRGNGRRGKEREEKSGERGKKRRRREEETREINEKE